MISKDVKIQKNTVTAHAIYPQEEKLKLRTWGLIT